MILEQETPAHTTFDFNVGAKDFQRSTMRLAARRQNSHSYRGPYVQYLNFADPRLPGSWLVISGNHPKFRRRAALSLSILIFELRSLRDGHPRSDWLTSVHGRTSSGNLAYDWSAR